MKLPIVVAVLAISGASAVAAEAVPLLDASTFQMALPGLTTSQAPVLVLQNSIAAAAATAESATATVGALTPLPIDARHLERIDAAPRFELLPDGALVMSFDPEEAGEPLVRDMLLREPTNAPVLPSAPLPLPSSALSSSNEVDSGSREIARALRTHAPAPLATQQARVFDPRETNVATPASSYLAGGLAVAALAGLSVLLYHRIRPNAALENVTRKVIFDAVCSTPGLGVHEISRIAGVSYSTATYHLERLVGAGMIVMTPDGNKLCYYKNGGAFSESERKILPLLKNEEAAKLFEAILDAPGTYRAALAERLGVTATTINWHLRRLREAGLVDETRAGRSAHLYARVETLRPTLLALAIKVETAEPITAERLRKYASSGASAASAGAGAA